MREIVPDKVTAGISFSARACLSDYPATAGWTLRLLLRGPSVININGIAEGDDHSFDVADTSTWAAGDCAFAIRATLDGNVVEIESGRMRVLPNLESATAGFDGRSHARVCLDAIEAVIAKRATLDQERYRINNRELYRTPLAELLKFRATYRAEVRNEENRARGRGRIGSVKVVMRHPGF